MVNFKLAGVATVGAVALGLSVGSAAPADAASLWSWSFGTSTNGASGTFTTADVSNPSNPVGTFNLIQFTLSAINGNSVSAQDTSLALSPQFVYNSASNYGFKNSNGFFDSSFQNWNGGGSYLLSGSAPYEASLPSSFRRANIVNFGGNFAIQNPADLKVNLVPSTSVPTPALFPGLIGLGVAALRKRKQEKVEAEV